jgi:hypothetical protein
MALAPDILIVAGQQDRVAARLRRDLEQINRRVSVLDGPSAARLFTIRVRPDAVVVAPSLPIFVRASAWWYDFASADADERFLRAEAYATFWAAAALSQAVVINRTGPGGAVGRMSAGALAVAMGTPDTACDIYASGPEAIEYAPDGMLWGEDLQFGVGSLATLRRGEPLRARKLNPAALYEIVTVVGDRAFAATTDPRSAELDLPVRSAQLGRRFEVHFATVTWAVDEESAMPVRFNPGPEESELRYAWREISEALCQDLTR